VGADGLEPPTSSL